MAGFQHRAEAEQFQRELTERLREFNLELHADKTRLIEFGRYAAENRAKQRKGKPETFDLLGYTHICETTRKGGFTVLRQTMRGRMQAKLQAIKQELRRRMHDPVPEVGKRLRSVVTGHYRYYGVPRNRPALDVVLCQLVRLWKKVLERRSHAGHIDWARMNRLARNWLPYTHVYRPYPHQRLVVTT